MLLIFNPLMGDLLGMRGLLCIDDNLLLVWMGKFACLGYPSKGSFEEVGWVSSLHRVSLGLGIDFRGITFNIPNLIWSGSCIKLRSFYTWIEFLSEVWLVL